MTTPGAEDRSGTTIEGRYLLGATIARGGMSTVYHGIDQRLDREVAVKIMHPDLALQPAFRIRFEREARAAAKLDHPCMVNVFDQGNDGDTTFLIMELVRGGTLRELLRERGPMPPHAAIAVMKPVLTALSLAHSHGMIHRDIKPDNVLIREDHQVKLADFGLVRAVSHTPDTGPVIGTAAYLSPEQIQGNSISPASDVYSAGILLFELLTGRTPFQGDNPTEIAMKRLTKEVPLPSTVFKNIPSECDQLVLSATHRDPQLRYADGGEFLEAVESTATVLNLAEFKIPVPRHSAVMQALEGADFADRRSWNDESMNTRAVGMDLSPHSETASDLRSTRIDMEPASHVRVPDSRENESSQLTAAYSDSRPNSYQNPDTSSPTEAHKTPVPRPATSPVQRSVPRRSRPKKITNRSPIGTIISVILLLCVLVAVALGAWWLSSGRHSDIPQIVGMGPEQAQTTISQAGFQFALKDVYSDTIPRDEVVGSDPPHGNRVPRGSTVTVLLSQGKPTVPEFSEGEELSVYQQRLQERSLKMHRAEEIYTEDTPRGSIARTDPSPGTEMKINGTVSVHLSKGPHPVEVPSVEKLSLSDAEKKLTDAGLTLGDITKVFNADRDNDEVIKSTPEAKQTVPKGTPVALEIAQSISIPDVLGKEEQEARSILEAAGLRVEVSQDTSKSKYGAGKVSVQSPAAKTKVDPTKETTVKIGISTSTTVPNVLFSKVSDAKETLAKAGFSVKVDGDSDGRVVTQSPGFQSSAPAGSTVTIKSIPLP